MLVVTISLYRVLCYFSSQSGLFWNTSFTFPSPHICLHYSCAWKYPFLLLVSRSCVCMCAQSCLTLCDPMDCSPPGCSVHGISQARILEWIAISYFRGSSQKGLNLHLFASPALAGRFFTTWATGEASGSPTHLLRHSAKSSLNNHICKTCKYLDGDTSLSVMSISLVLSDGGNLSLSEEMLFHWYKWVWMRITTGICH